MANRTVAQQIAALEARRDALEAAVLASSSSTAVKSATLGPMSFTSADHSSLVKDLAQVERDIQRLYAGGRGIVVDHSANDGSGSLGPRVYTTYEP